MKLKILIAEDKYDELDASIRTCKRISKEEGFLLSKESIITASTTERVIELLKSEPFEFDIVVLDIGFGETDLNVEALSQYLKADILAESKVIIHSGNASFKTDPDKILTAICNGVKTIALKGELNGIYSFDTQFRRILRDIKYETIWANIGRFSPKWKRNLFRDDKLWSDLGKGKKVEKAFMLLDISNSTQFVITQRTASIDDNHIFELFRNFANLTTSILEEDQNKGIVERYGGDEIFAYFDLDTQKTEKLENVILCARKINTTFKEKVIELYKKYEFNAVKSGQNTVWPELRILVGCGEILWVLQGADSRPQLSIMTDKVAKFYRCFTNRDINNYRTLQPGNIYITHDVFIHTENFVNTQIESTQELDLRDFNKFKIYKLK